MIILIGSEKGGTGKTTITTNLAAKHIMMGGDPIIVDTDKLGSANDWSSLRDDFISRKDEEGNAVNKSKIVKRIPCVQKNGVHISSEIVGLTKRYGDIFVDTAGRDTVELRSAMTVADILLIPIQASQFDVWTLGKMNLLIEQNQAYNPSLKAFVVPNRASTNQQVKEIHELEDNLTEFENLFLYKTIIKDRIAYRKAAKEGLSVFEIKDQDQKAIFEMNCLYEEIFYE